MKRICEAKKFVSHAVLAVLHRASGYFWMWLGIGLTALGFYLLSVLPCWNPGRVGLQATALSCAIGVTAAKHLSGERISASRWAGVLLVCFGVAVLWAAHGTGQMSFRMRLTGLRWLVLALACAPFAYYLLSVYSAWHFFREHRRRGPATRDFMPLVSILKPVRGLDCEAYENYSSFCRQDYPEYEILFAVSDADDPAIPVVQKLIYDFPERSIRLLVGSENLGPNNKVCKLCRLVSEARYELLVISDSDVRVGTDYLRAVLSPFQDPEVGAVTCLYIGLAARQLCAELEAIGIASEFFASVLVARRLEGLKFALGATMATTRQRLAEIGGFEAMVNQHSDDFELGHRIAARGWRIELSPYTVSTGCPAQTLRAFFEHQLRWARTTRLSRPKGYLGLLLTYGLPWSLIAAAVAPSAALAAGYLGAYLVLRFLTAWTVGVWGMKDPVLRRKLWLLPLRDMLQFFVWFSSIWSHRIVWRGAEFLVRKDCMVAVSSRSEDGWSG